MPEQGRVLAAAVILSLFAMAAAASADEHQEPLPPWPADATGLGGQLDADITAPPALVPGTEDVVGAEDLQQNPPATAAAPIEDVDEPDPVWLPELSAEADMSECARDLLRSRLATTVTEDDILAAMALEAELLTLCRERQELVWTLYQAEAALEELRHAGEGDAGEGEGDVQVLSLLDQFVEPAAPPIEDVEEEAPPRPEEPAAEVPPAEEPQPVLAWFSILGVKGALRAGITDGQQVWWVTEGTELPGGVTVATITGQPPKVVVDGDETATLPWAARPGGS